MKKLVFILISLSCIGLYAQKNGKESLKESSLKLANTMQLIDYFYVDDADLKKISEKGIESILKELDPHSVFITEEDVQKMNEPLVGNFDGIGVSFQIHSDTIHVIDVISGGPAEKVGMLAGDRIIKVDDLAAVGDSIKNDWVFKHLRGKKGSKVKVTALRKGRNEPIVFDITRDKIPINSIDTWFMIDKNTGYIRLNRFAQTSNEEFSEAISDLKKQGMKNLIFDLRGNGGGYLNIAFEISDQFLDKDKLIVYTQGSKSPKQELKSERKGEFEQGRLVILVDETSASASEIVSGAVQDWDRGVLVGRRTFGKGLVQRPFVLPDGSQIRLTTSRYYTPSGRCIQKPYDEGTDSYQQDYERRYKHGELLNADSIHFADSLKCFTAAGRVVYGGGGIMPDVFMPIDTSRASDYLINLRSKGLFNTFALEWVEQNRESFMKKAPDYDSFSKEYDKLNLLSEFEKFAVENGVRKNEIKKEWVNSIVMDCLKEETSDTNAAKYDSYKDYADFLLSDKGILSEIRQKAKQEDEKTRKTNAVSDKYIASTLKALIARNLYGIKYYYMTMQDNDEELQKAIEIIKDEKLYNSILKK